MGWGGGVKEILKKKSVARLNQATHRQVIERMYRKTEKIFLPEIDQEENFAQQSFFHPTLHKIK